MAFKRALVVLVLGFNSVDAAELAQRVSQLEQEVQALKQQVNDLQSLIESKPSEPPHSTTSTGTAAPQLILKDWHYRTEPRKFDVDYAIDVILYNGFDKAIQEVEARLDFKTLLGNHLYSVSITHDLDIPAGESVVDKGSRANKRLLGENHQMKRMNQEDIRATLVVRKIVFEDGTVFSF